MAEDKETKVAEPKAAKPKGPERMLFQILEVPKAGMPRIFITIVRQANQFKGTPHFSVPRIMNQALQIVIPEDAEYWDDEVANLKKKLKKKGLRYRINDGDVEGILPDDVKPKTPQQKLEELAVTAAQKTTDLTKLAAEYEGKKEENTALQDRVAELEAALKARK